MSTPAADATAFVAHLSIAIAPARTPEPTYGTRGEVEQGGDRAVLPVRTVQHRHRDRAALQHADRVTEAELDAVGIRPPAVAVDREGDDLVPRGERVGDGGRGRERDVVLDAAAAADHRDPHGVTAGR